MRSTNIVIFLVLLNVAAGVGATVAPGDVVPATGASGEIDSVADDVQNREVKRPASDELIGSFFGVGALITTIKNVVFFGPEMLRNLGAPGVLVSGFETVLVFVVAFDIAEAVTGRNLS